MRRVLAFAATAALVTAGAASAETWTKYVDGANGTNWSFDGDYLYKDQKTGRLVVLQAIAKPDAHIGPSAPGKPDGVGNVVAIDCAKKNMILMGSYSPKQPLDIKDGWRKDRPARVEGAENTALMAAVCPHLDHAPVK